MCCNNLFIFSCFVFRIHDGVGDVNDGGGVFF